MRHLLVIPTVLALLLASASAVGAQEASPDPEASPAPEQPAEAEELLAAATCLGKPATIVAIAGVETMGTPDADVIVGTEGDDVIKGDGGNDRICAGDGADLVEGGEGKDRIDGGDGDDQLDGGAGNDTIDGGTGADMVIGAADNDRLTGGRGDDTLDGGLGTDVCDGGKGTDWLPGCNDKRRTKGKLVIKKNTTLKGPHRGPIVIAANKVTLDCRGHTVKGRGTGFGIWADNKTRVTVKNCDVTNFAYGIHLDRGQRNTITGNFAHHNSQHGISMWDSNKNKLTLNVADDNGFGKHATFGIVLNGNSNGNRLVGNQARNNGETQIGVDSADTSKNLVKDNVVVGGDNGFTSRGTRHTFIGNSASNARSHGFTDYEGTRFSVFQDNIAIRNGTGFTIGGRENTLTGNAADENGFVGFTDGSVPGVNSYQDNTCIGNGHQGSQPDGLCDDTPPVEPEPSPQPSDRPDSDVAATAEE